jgi:hypothetical protein
MRIPCLLAACALALLPHPAVAQVADDDRFGPDPSDWEFLLGASGANDSDFDSGAFSLSASLGYFLSEGWELGARHNMTFFDADDTDSNFAATTRGFIDYHFDLGRLRPFLGANAGGLYGDEGVDEAFVVGPELGVKFFALEKTFILGQMEYQFAFEDADDADDAADDGQFLYTLGIGFNF